MKLYIHIYYMLLSKSRGKNPLRRSIFTINTLRVPIIKSQFYKAFEDS